MGIKQYCTFYKDYTMKSYLETLDGFELVYIKYDKCGSITLERWWSETIKKHLWVKKKYKYINGKAFTEHFTLYDGTWIKRKFDADGRMTYEERNEGVSYDIYKNINIDFGKKKQYK